ncbi:MAG TPA: hypothetical protein VD770_04265, partial [Coxiellaceae bacterium]|nr:hypothetical protein [Coxiellaceae bacterium]
FFRFIIAKDQLGLFQDINSKSKLLFDSIFSRERLRYFYPLIKLILNLPQAQRLTTFNLLVRAEELEIAIINSILDMFFVSTDHPDILSKLLPHIQYGWAILEVLNGSKAENYSEVLNKLLPYIPEAGVISSVLNTIPDSDKKSSFDSLALERLPSRTELATQLLELLPNTYTPYKADIKSLLQLLPENERPPALCELLPLPYAKCARDFRSLLENFSKEYRLKALQYALVYEAHVSSISEILSMLPIVERLTRMRELGESLSRLPSREHSTRNILNIVVETIGKGFHEDRSYTLHKDVANLVTTLFGDSDSRIIAVYAKFFRLKAKVLHKVSFLFDQLPKPARLSSFDQLSDILVSAQRLGYLNTKKNYKKKNFNKIFCLVALGLPINLQQRLICKNEFFPQGINEKQLKKLISILQVTKNDLANSLLGDIFSGQLLVGENDARVDNYDRATKYYEAVSPTSLYYPLAQESLYWTYTGLGKTEKADEILKKLNTRTEAMVQAPGLLQHFQDSIEEITYMGRRAQKARLINPSYIQLSLFNPLRDRTPLRPTDNPYQLVAYTPR